MNKCFWEGGCATTVGCREFGGCLAQQHRDKFSSEAKMNQTDELKHPWLRVSYAIKLNETDNEGNGMKQTEVQVQELVDAVIDNHTSYVTTNRLSRATKPFLPVKPRVMEVLTADGEIQAIQLTSEVTTRLSPTAGVDVNKVLSVLLEAGVTPESAELKANKIMNVIADAAIDYQTDNE